MSSAERELDRCKFLTRFGARLEQRRKALGMKGCEFARAVGISRSDLYRYETAQMMPSALVYVLIQQFLAEKEQISATSNAGKKRVLCARNKRSTFGSTPK